MTDYDLTDEHGANTAAAARAWRRADLLDQLSDDLVDLVARLRACQQPLFTDREQDQMPVTVDPLARYQLALTDPKVLEQSLVNVAAEMQIQAASYRKYGNRRNQIATAYLAELEEQERLQTEGEGQ
jgi:hypothetical protein